MEWNIKNEFCLWFYHTAFYHRLDEEGTGILLHASDELNFISLPLIIRKIEGTTFTDATSVYGYCGPICSQNIKDVDDNLLEYFKNEITKYFTNNNIIAAFSRLHPLIEQKSLFNNLGEVLELNKTVSIDLTLPIEIQRRAFRRTLKSDLNQLRRKGYTSVVANSNEEIDEFIDIYYETMDRVEATPNYYFSKEYFHDFFSNKEFSNKSFFSLNKMSNEIKKCELFINNYPQFCLMKKEFGFGFLDVTLKSGRFNFGFIQNDLILRNDTFDISKSDIRCLFDCLDIDNIYFIGEIENTLDRFNYLNKVFRLSLKF